MGGTDRIYWHAADARCSDASSKEVQLPAVVMCRRPGIGQGHSRKAVWMKRSALPLVLGV
jgi:hypothetical protein